MNCMKAALMVAFLHQNTGGKGNVFDKTSDDNLFEIHYILSKTDKNGLYDTILFKEKDDFSELDSDILAKIDFSILQIDFNKIKEADNNGNNFNIKR